MNNKGFTLIELLATLVILSLVMGIASAGVTSYIKTSKNKSEKVFVEKLSSSIEAYINLNGSNLPKIDNTTYSFLKCRTSTCNTDENSYTATAYQVTSIYLTDLISAKIIDEAKVINPSNKEKCLSNGKNPEIKVYKDSDYVYYYYVDLSETNTSCDISKENGIIDTRPQKLKEAIEGESDT